MSTHKAVITKESDSFYALIVRIDNHGEHVIRGYNGRHFKTEKAAIKSTGNYIAKWLS